MASDAFREKLNLFLYASKERNLGILRVITLLVSLLAISGLVYYHGFPWSQDSQDVYISIVKNSLSFYVLNYIIRILYSFESVQFLKDNWKEGVVLFMGMILIPVQSLHLDGFVLPVFKFLQNQSVINSFHAFLQFYIFFNVILEIWKSSKAGIKSGVAPSVIFIFSFLLLILGGAVLLMLPETQSGQKEISLVNAIFTSVSASCLTGLTAINIANDLSYKGQLVLLFQIQAGGILIVTFSAFFASFSLKKMRNTQQNLIKDFISSDDDTTSFSLAKRILYIMIGIELVGAIAIYSLWHPDLVFKSTAEKIYFSLFHSVSAFNHTGLSLFPKGLMNDLVSKSYILHILLGVLIFTGSLGFPVLMDMFSRKKLRERLRLPWKKWRPSTKIALYSGMFLTTAGTLVFYLLEKNRVLASQNLMESIITSVFQSVSARSCGFATIEIASLSLPVLLFIMLLMFIGGSSGSVGGGIKTSTFSLIILSATGTITGKKRLEIFKSTISFELLNRAYTIVLFSVMAIVIGVFLLSLSDPGLMFYEILFEEISAFTNVGFNSGVTQKLSENGKIVLIVSMFTGRVGILTLAYALGKHAESINYKYPAAHFMVG